MANNDAARVSVIDTATNAVVTTIPAGQPADVAVAPDGSHVYVTNFSSSAHEVSVIDTATNAVVTTIPVDSYPIGVAATARNVYVAIVASQKVSVIDV